MVSIPACHAGDRGSIPRRGELYFDNFMNLCLAQFLFISKIITFDKPPFFVKENFFLICEIATFKRYLLKTDSKMKLMQKMPLFMYMSSFSMNGSDHAFLAQWQSTSLVN